MNLYITIPVEEGEQYRIGKIDFRGELLRDKKDLLKLMTVRDSELFNRSRLVNDIQKLNDLYKDVGYAYVNIQPLTAIDLHALRPFFSVQAEVAGSPALVSRTGYTGEDGFELYVAPQHADREIRPADRLRSESDGRALP